MTVYTILKEYTWLVNTIHHAEFAHQDWSRVILLPHKVSDTL